MGLASEADSLNASVQFDILKNPFAILKLPIDASLETVRIAFEDAMSEGQISDNDLRNARRDLSTPKHRLAATIGYLPDAPRDRRDAAIDALQRSTPLTNLLEIANDLQPLSRLLFLSNVAQKSASYDVLRTFAEALDEFAPSDLVDCIAATAGNSVRDPEAIYQGLADARKSAADRLFSCYRDSDQAAADVLQYFRKKLSTSASERTENLNLISKAYEDSTANDRGVARRRIEELAGNLKASPDYKPTLDALDKALAHWGKLAKPIQILAESKQRQDPESESLFGLLRGVSIAIHNEKDRPAVSFHLATVCRKLFENLHRAREVLDEDISTLREAVDQAGVAKLAEFILSVKANPAQLIADVRQGGFVQTSPRLAGQLYALFRDAVAVTRGTSAADMAWGLVRVLAIDINNDHDDGVAAEKIIAGLCSHPDFGRVPETIRTQIEADLVTLRSNAAQGRLKLAMERRDQRAARAALEDLASLTANATEKREFTSAIAAIDSLNSRRVGKFVVWGVVAVGAFVIVANANWNSTTSYRPASTVDYNPPTPPAPQTSQPVTAPTVTPPAETFDEDTPVIGFSGAFSRANIRYCLYAAARLDAINTELADETSQRVIDAFNRDVDDYNLRCGNFRYYEEDMAAVKREVTLNQALLTAQGLQLLRGWRFSQ